MDIKNIIYKRKSIRKYKAEPVEKEKLSKVKALMDNVTPLYKDINMQGILVENGIEIQKISKGIIGSYGKIEAPHYIVITSEEKEGFHENIGFAFEKLVLELTNMGLGTCWIGGSIKKELLNGVVEVPEGEIPVIMIAFGYPEDNNIFNIELSSGHKRKALEDIALGTLNDNWEEIFQGVRRAPSAVNLQPWRFYKDHNEIHAYIAEGNIITRNFVHFYRLDMGIALSHLKLMCEYKDLKVEFINKELPNKKGLQYITTAKVK